MIGRYNVTGGGETRLWDITAPTGNYDEEEFSRGEMDDKLILDHSLTEPWETVYFSDRKFKHEARAVTETGLDPGSETSLLTSSGNYCPSFMGLLS